MTYQEEIISLQIKNKNISLFQVKNVDEVFDALIQSSPTEQAYIDEQIPYWTEIWPSAIALAEYITEASDRFQNKKVIEIGAGLGLPSIAAAAYTQSITTTDYLKDALLFAKKNADLNTIDHIEYKVLDWREISSNHEKYDIILASDVAYEKRFFDGLPKALLNLMHEDSIAILTEPGRKFASPFLLALPNFFKVDAEFKSITWRGVETKVGIYINSPIKIS